MKSHIVLPWPPSVNTYYRAIPRGRRAVNILSRKGREFKASLHGIVPGFRFKAPTPVAVTIYLHAPTRRAYDLDNRLKATQDALVQIGAIDDDNQIDRITVHRCQPIKGGKAVIHMEAINE